MAFASSPAIALTGEDWLGNVTKQGRNGQELETLFAFFGSGGLRGPALRHQTQKTGQGTLVGGPIPLGIHASPAIKLGGHRLRFLVRAAEPLQSNGEFRKSHGLGDLFCGGRAVKPTA